MGILSDMTLGALAGIAESVENKLMPSKTHGLSSRVDPTPEYAIWMALRCRCNNPNHSSYRYYGARGVGVCERWDDFACFYSDMGPRPSPEYSIDRIDSNKDYEPENCRWATASQQSLNRRGNIFVEVNGERLCISDAIRRAGINKSTVYNRIRRGLTHQQAVDGLIAEVKHG